ncbi:hypothetical protein B0H63DRAFT_530217 [Podospora didyma]|uniref:Uncharacterized protein n=1 Tax=Podospora didyma TaxID=330526 RepID=A0AAE0U6I3_9PEZI|nr:hypothetical protein B0H63DRAFT_530217 [Podospora didyma]
MERPTLPPAGGNTPDGGDSKYLPYSYYPNPCDVLIWAFDLAHDEQLEDDAKNHGQAPIAPMMSLPLRPGPSAASTTPPAVPGSTPSAPMMSFPIRQGPAPTGPIMSLPIRQGPIDTTSNKAPHGPASPALGGQHRHNKPINGPAPLEPTTKDLLTCHPRPSMDLRFPERPAKSYVSSITRVASTASDVNAADDDTMTNNASISPAPLSGEKKHKLTPDTFFGQIRIRLQT